MTVQELIDKLQEYPKDLRVMIEGYEGGYEDLETLATSKIALNVHDEDDQIYGNHEDCDHFRSDEKSRKTTNALIFRRYTGF